ncbi:hypothetical protein SSX86_032478, partial [Deinandra increscens subsp. villosa]
MLRYSSGGDFATAKRKYDDSTTAPPPSTARRQTGFSAPIIPSHSSDSASAYNSVPPPVDEIELAKQRAKRSLLWMDKEGKTPLMLACMNTQLYDVGKTLIVMGANVNAYRPGRQAGTPLHHAAGSGLGEMVNLLLSHGANALTLNDDCQTALDVARVKGYSNIVRAIELRPNFADAWSNLGSAYMRKGRLTEAAQCCRQALSLNPRLVDAHSNLGNLMKAQGSVQQHALQSKPDYAMAFGE